MGCRWRLSHIKAKLAEFLDKIFLVGLLVSLQSFKCLEGHVEKILIVILLLIGEWSHCLSENTIEEFPGFYSK